MWTDENRARYDRSKLRYPSDLTDEEWSLIGPLIPPAKPGGNARTVVVREVVDGLMYILSTGCQWSALPKDLPPRSTVNDYFRRWSDGGTLDRIHHALYVQCRELNRVQFENRSPAYRAGGADARSHFAIADGHHYRSQTGRGLAGRKASRRLRLSTARA